MSPEAILKDVFDLAFSSLENSNINDEVIRLRVDDICRCTSNRAGVRLLMACLLGKEDNPVVDPRRPYTEIGGSDCFSGRTYDERYLTPFINEHRLPCNPTTAFLTPSLRNIDFPLTTDVQIVGRPRELYIKTLQLLDDVYQGKVIAKDLLVEVIRILINMRDEQETRMTSLLDSLNRTEGSLPLSSETIINLIKQHLSCKNASRLPVLVVAAAYHTAGGKLGERALPLHSHNAADSQTGSIGDIEISLMTDDDIVTAYEMKMKSVTINDIDVAVAKIARVTNKIHNYIFITTDTIDQKVVDYAKTFYEKTDGTEIVILDCIGFLRYFLHLFHRIRLNFLNAYQDLVINEPNSSVSQTLKEAFLALRNTAETDSETDE
jgi:hypothetical protein